MIRKHRSRAAKAAFAISLGVAIVIGLFAAVFARPAHSAGTTVIIGTKNFPEEFILGQLYKQALEAKGFTIDRRKISLEDPLKTIGEYHVPVKLHREVTSHVKVTVKGDQPEAEAVAAAE